MTNLVIVESPAKCSKIQGYLGQGWKVIASLGHIRHLKEELASVGLEQDFESNWEFMKEKAKAIAAIKDAAKGASTIYLASDDDREGELIAYSVALLLKLPVETTPRAVFHEITQTAVKAAVAQPRRLDMNKVNAAQARAVLDMMVGFTISPLLWRHVAPSLSAGRCQTPALRLVCDREKDIESFTVASSWTIHGIWSCSDSKGLPFEATLTDELEDEESSRNYLENLHGNTGAEILSEYTKPWSESAPLPLITSTLQQQSSSLFRINPKDAMKIAQRLYEAGHITYMRTDKAILSDEAKEAARVMITQNYGANYIGGNAPQPKKTKSKATAKAQASKDSQEPKTQDAHEAIRPTHFDVSALPTDEDWSARDRKIYHLIWLRAIQSCMASVQGQQRSIVFASDADDPADFTWRATWRKTIFDGWRRAASKDTDEAAEQDTEEKAWDFAASLSTGQRLSWDTLYADPHETKAPPRFTEATLVRELEQKGIGRPSTFASLISTIQDKGYAENKNTEARQIDVMKLSLASGQPLPPTEEMIQRKVGGEKDRLAPTPLGLSVLNFCLSHFQDLFDYTFTASMESRLDQIAEGQELWKQVLRDTWSSYKERYSTLSKAPGASPHQEGARRREFGGGLAAVQTKKGPLLLRENPTNKDATVFYGWPTGAIFETLTADDAANFAETSGKAREGIHLGEHDGHPVVRKSGKFGIYAEWNGKTTGCSETDTLEQIIEKFSTTASKTVRMVGQFEIREGQYGPYMFKKDITGPSRKFVSVPKHLNLEEVTEPQLIAIFQSELQKKSRSGAYGAQRGGSAQRGGGAQRGSSSYRGRGRGRGRGA
jgi:DNA topoisomerase-1